LIGVLLTRGQPTVIYPESLLTFRLVEAVTISTDRAPQAFRSAAPADYQQPANPAPPERVAAPCGPYGCPPSYPLYYSYPYWPPYYGYGYGYGYPYFYGPSFSFYYGGYYGSRFYGSHYGHGGGFGHGHHR
jgi:CubicO group peptidase (beta-lactamase class C family)